MDFSVRPTRTPVDGCLGPNGAGKTTTLRMLLGLIRRDAGTVRLFGRDPAHGHSSLDGVAGFVESPTFYPYLSGRENLELPGALDGGVEHRWVDECLDRVELLDRARDRVGGYSLGMRQRLGIAASRSRTRDGSRSRALSMSFAPRSAKRPGSRLPTRHGRWRSHASWESRTPPSKARPCGWKRRWPSSID
ncbi:MAG: ATP-binding cassette domain-containing protein [Thermoleophilia bacterium]|nr:ATP-binding cassette domain-containing protein [Thermoleophilia bacterium]